MAEESQASQASLWRRTIEGIKTGGKPFKVFLVNGIKLEFERVEDLDDLCMVASGGSHQNAGSTQLVTFHSISTIIPNSTSGDRHGRR